MCSDPKEFSKVSRQMSDQNISTDSSEKSLVELTKGMQEVHQEGFMAESPKTYDLLREKVDEKGDYISEIPEKNCCEESLLLSLPPEVREHIWKMIPRKTLTSTVRKICRKFRDDVDYMIGNFVVLDDSVSDLMEWSAEVAVQSLCIKRLMRPLSRWCPKNTGEDIFLRYPYLLKEIKLEGQISVANLHEILLNCKNVESLSVLVKNLPHQPKHGQTRFGDGFTDLFLRYTGCLRDLVEIHGSLKNYPVFHSLRKIDLVCTGITESERPRCYEIFLKGFVRPFLEHSDICPKLNSFKLNINCDNSDSDRILEFLINKPAMKYIDAAIVVGSQFRRLDPQWIFNPLDDEGAHAIRKKKNIPQLNELSLVIVNSVDFRGWFSLIEPQCRLTVLKSDICPLFWKHYYLPVMNCSKTLTKICLKDLKTSDVNDTESHPLNLEMFKDCERLLSLNLFGFNSQWGGRRVDDNKCRLINIRKLPQCIKDVTLEAFKIDPPKVYELHEHLVNMDQLVLLYWNKDTQDVLTSFGFIKDIMKDRNYRQICIADRNHPENLYLPYENVSEEEVQKSISVRKDLVHYVEQNRDHPMILRISVETPGAFVLGFTEDPRPPELSPVSISCSI